MRFLFEITKTFLLCFALSLLAFSGNNISTFENISGKGCEEQKTDLLANFHCFKRPLDAQKEKPVGQVPVFVVDDDVQKFVHHLGEFGRVRNHLLHWRAAPSLARLV